ncbi:hypothetical protein HPP92_012264 [Vanilla planifolia]|uniref:Uncharacterized protein n=1 Tax=Vanilla planifolia TaxID=51239 RepID=A0A835QQ59_VANPL|nr:hypothetical protein HPP92_012264 [Vanilla planifolia]
MCSYHNGNRLNLPANPSLQRSLQLALRSKDAHDMKRAQEDDEDDQEDSEDREYDAEDRILQGDISGFRKRMKHGMDHESFPNPVGSKDFNRRSNHQGITMDASHVTTEGSRAAVVHMHVIRSHSIHLEEQSLHIQSQMLELEKQQFKWQCFSKKKDRELDKMRIENERMRVDNEKLALELKHKQVELGICNVRASILD